MQSWSNEVRESVTLGRPCLALLLVSHREDHGIWFNQTHLEGQELPLNTEESLPPTERLRANPQPHCKTLPASAPGPGAASSAERPVRSPAGRAVPGARGRTCR